MIVRELVSTSAAKFPDRTAIRGPDGQLTYRELDEAANRLAHLMLERGVEKGDRVGIWAEKSTRAVVAMQAVLRCGAAYVPLDPLNPLPRIRTIVEDARMRLVATSADRALLLQEALPGLEVIPLEGGEEAGCSAAPPPSPEVGDDDLAWILYTSGSTGVPKGVCISQRNAMAFIEWAVEELSPTPEDRFANHAPFFFDLSVLDLYAAFMSGASVSLVPEPLAYAPLELVAFLERERITVWYSVPSALILMMEQGGLLGAALPELRAMLFAGEPFPLKHLRRLREHLSGARFLNLYGPTETNVCTFYEVHGIAEDRVEPVPIGRPCCGDRAWIADASPRSEEDPTLVGELVIEGPTVMLGYWGAPPHHGPYATGDLVRQTAEGDYEYLGRRDHMVKIRGRRIEPGEIEAALLTHPALKEVAVVVAGSGMDARLVAFAVAEGKRPGLLGIKRHCAERLPTYMIVDELRFLEALPRTRNGKVDRRALTAELEAQSAVS